MMNEYAKEMWVKALRSKAYPQAFGGLRKEGGYCCLGVLVDCYFKDNPGKEGCGWELLSSESLLYEAHFENDVSSGTLPIDGNFYEWVGDISGDEERILINCNDERKLSFSEIAEYIEANL